MLVELAVAYQDTDPGELGWSVDLGPAEPLAVRRIDFPGLCVELRLLGASHQIAVWSAGAGAALSNAPICTETVACLPGRTEPLPRRARRDLSGWAYSFESTVRSFGASEFSRRVARIERCAPRGLVGRYPGGPGAVTAIAIRSRQRGLRWITWHTYPQDLRIATTLSRLRCPGGAGADGAGAR